MTENPIQTSENSIKRRRQSQFNPNAVVGAENNFKTLRNKAMKNYYNRRMILTVPEEIKAAHPDKHFVYINYNRLQQQGMFHEMGYSLFKVQKDPEALDSQDFSKSFDGLIHRREMALAYIPKAEYEERKMEQALIRGDRDLSNFIKMNPNLAGFNPIGEEKVEKNH